LVGQQDVVLVSFVIFFLGRSVIGGPVAVDNKL
jgi:hypothetical protein